MKGSRVDNLWAKFGNVEAITSNTHQIIKYTSRALVKVEWISEGLPKFDEDRQLLTRESQSLILESFPQLHIPDTGSQQMTWLCSNGDQYQHVQSDGVLTEENFRRQFERLVAARDSD